MDNKDNSDHKQLPNINESSSSSNESCESFEYQADIEESDVDTKNLARRKMHEFKKSDIRLSMLRRNVIRDNMNMLRQRSYSSNTNYVSTDTENEILSYKPSLSLPSIKLADFKSEEYNIKTLSKSENAPGCSFWPQSTNVAKSSVQSIEITVSKSESSCTRYFNNILAKTNPIHERNTDDEPKDYSMKNKKVKTDCEVTSNTTEENKVSIVEKEDTDSESS